MMKAMEDKTLVLVVALVTIGMVWIALPFSSAILWALVVSVVFAPVNQRLMLRMPKRPGTATLITLLLIIAMVIIPAAVLATLLLDQAADLYIKLQGRQIDVGDVLAQIKQALPGWVQPILERYGLADLAAIERKLSAVLTSGLKLAVTQAVSVGQGAFSFVIELGIMLYLTYFLLRDGRQLTRTIGARVPMRDHQKAALFDKFIIVTRATIKGSLVVALAQGVVGGIIFALLGIDAALLWGVVMAFLALIPAVGTGLVWVPTSIYLLATGSVWQGVVLALCGFFIISMIDNVLRPIMVGKDTRMPDYVVLIATLGGLSVFGMNGLILGPVIAALFMASWDIFAQERAEASDD